MTELDGTVFFFGGTLSIVHRLIFLNKQDVPEAGSVSIFR